MSNRTSPTPSHHITSKKAASNTKNDLPFYFTTPPPKLTQEYNQLPSIEEFNSIVNDYLQNLSSKKRDKALVDNTRYHLILQVLRDPRNTSISTAQFRFWVKKMFKLIKSEFSEVVCHDDKPVAIRENIYQILALAHKEAHHGGRDKTSALVTYIHLYSIKLFYPNLSFKKKVRKSYSWIPKELIARFVRHCPFCIARRNGCQSPSLKNGFQYMSTPKRQPSPTQWHSMSMAANVATSAAATAVAFANKFNPHHSTPSPTPDEHPFDFYYSRPTTEYTPPQQQESTQPSLFHSYFTHHHPSPPPPAAMLSKSSAPTAAAVAVVAAAAIAAINLNPSSPTSTSSISSSSSTAASSDHHPSFMVSNYLQDKLMDEATTTTTIDSC